MKEAFSYALESSASPVVAPRNQWPASPADFRNHMVTYVEAVESLARRLLGLFALALDLPEDYFTTTYPPWLGAVRALKYPPQPTSAADLEVGIGAHTDYSMFTLLCQDDVGGLEVQNANGVWIPVTPRLGTFVVNIGDPLQWVSGARFQSTRHRVVNRGQAGSRQRFSMAFFKSPSLDAVLTVAPTCKDPNATGVDDRLVMRDYVRMRKSGSRLQHPSFHNSVPVTVTETGPEETS